MKKLLLFCLVLVGMTQVVHGQHFPMNEVVYLKNGSIIRGVIVEQIPNKSLKIETADGNLFVFDMDEIEKITKEPGRRSDRDAHRQSEVEESRNKSGRRMGMVQFFGIGYDGSYEDYGNYDSYYYDEGVAYINVHFIYGYQFKQRFFIGGGIGMEHLGGDALPDSYNLRIPLFASAKINLTKTRVSPFFQFDAGYHFNTDDYTEDGVFFQPKFGVDFNMGWSRRKALFLSLSLIEYGITDETGYYYNHDYDSSWNNGYDFYPKVGLNFGLRF